MLSSTAEACTRILYICVTSYSIARQHIFVGGLEYCVTRWSPWLRGLPHWVGGLLCRDLYKDLGVCREGDTSPRSRRRLLNCPLGNPVEHPCSVVHCIVG